jgi:thiamine-monophosphate kinase
MKRRSPETLASLGEKGLLHALTGAWKSNPKRVLVGVGDDCAVLPGHGRNHYLLFKTDAVVEGVHFTKETRPALIGRKALSRALSDLAAMGARPLSAVITLGLTPEESPQRLRGIYSGLRAVAKKYGVDLVGGETTRAAQLFLNIALLGECRGHRPVLRSTARAGELLFVTGRLGGSQSGKHLTFPPRLAEGEWLALHGYARAMMDLSDGLGADLPRLAEASRLGFIVEAESIPRSRGATVAQAINDGEDYELLFTVKSSQAERLKKEWPFATPLHSIGVMRPRSQSAGPLIAHGFDHFKQR